MNRLNTCQDGSVTLVESGLVFYVGQSALDACVFMSLANDFKKHHDLFHVNFTQQRVTNSAGLSSVVVLKEIWTLLLILLFLLSALLHFLGHDMVLA